MKRKILILLSLLLVCGFCFSACGESKEEYIERMKSEALVSVITKKQISNDNDLTYKTDSSYFYKNDIPETENTKLNSEKYEWNGKTYNLKPVQDEYLLLNKYDDISPFVVSKILINSSSDVKSIEFLQESKEFCREWYHTPSANEADYISIDEGKEIALTHIETIINGKYNKDIDISEYDYFGPPDDITDDQVVLRYEWRKKVNGVYVHRVRISSDRAGNILAAECYPYPDEEIIDKIVTLTEGEYLEIATSRINDLFKDEKDVSFDIHLDDEIKPSLRWMHEHNCYAIFFRVHWTASTSDGISNEYFADFYLPLK